MQHNHTGEKQYTALAIDSRSPVESPLGIPGLSKEMLVKDKTSHVEVKYENASNSSQDQGASVSTRDDALDFAPTQQKTAVISVLLVDDHALMREGLKQLLELEEDIHVVSEAVDGFDALYKIRQLRPEVVLLDIRMPMIDGIAVTRQITHEFPSIAVIILTISPDHQQMLQAMRNGARGYLLKSVSSQELTQAIRTVHQGGVLIEPELTGAIVREFRRLSNSTQTYVNALSGRDIEILRYVAAGMSNKEIAVKLSYSEKTVKNYLSLIFQKLGIRDRTQAAIFALRQGFLPDDEI
jgi:DNA-binding NarL/FixJ family response regulator